MSISLIPFIVMETPALPEEIPVSFRFQHGAKRAANTKLNAG